jgi:hypothetical protein
MAFSFNSVCSNVVPKGTYVVVIEDIKFKVSSSGTTTNDMVVKYVITEGPYAKRVISETISEKAFAFKLKPFLKAAGVDTAKEFKTAEELYNYGITASKGKKIMVTLGIRYYNGNEYNQVDAYAALPGSTTTAEDVVAELGLNASEIAPAKPTIEDLPQTPEAPSVDSEEPILDFDNTEKLF